MATDSCQIKWNRFATPGWTDVLYILYLKQEMAQCKFVNNLYGQSLELDKRQHTRPLPQTGRPETKKLKDTPKAGHTDWLTDRPTDNVTWPWPRLGMWLRSTSFNDATCCLKYTATNNWVTVKWATIGVQALRCWSLDTSETRSEILWDFRNVVLRRMEKTSWTNRVKMKKYYVKSRWKRISCVQ